MLEDNSLDKNYEILKKYSEEVIKPCFGVGNFSFFSSSDGNGSLNESCSYYSFHGSKYFYNEENRFIHFTSLDNLFHIVNSGYFIASQLSSLDDPLELKFASQHFENVENKNQFIKLKENLFILSLCQYNDKKSDTFPMWNMYGKNGRGIGIVLSFHENFLNWYNSFLAPVKYGDEDGCEKKWKDYFSKHYAFIKHYPEFKLLENPFSIKAGIPNLIAIFHAFYKSRLYAVESEVRFLKSFIGEIGEPSPQNKTIGIKLNSKNEMQYFYKIPILNKESMESLNEKSGRERVNLGQPDDKYKNFINDLANNEPLIKIEKVILGYRYRDNDLYRIENSIKSEICQKLNYQFDGFKLSTLSKEFYG